MTNHLRFSTAMFDSRRKFWYDRGSALGFSGRSHASSEWWFPPSFVDQRCLQGEPNLRRAGVPCLVVFADAGSWFLFGHIYRGDRSLYQPATPWVICWDAPSTGFRMSFVFFSPSSGHSRWAPGQERIERIERIECCESQLDQRMIWIGCPIFTILRWFPDRGSLIFMVPHGAPGSQKVETLRIPTLAPGDSWCLVSPSPETSRGESQWLEPMWNDSEACPTQSKFYVSPHMLKHPHTISNHWAISQYQPYINYIISYYIPFSALEIGDIPFSALEIGRNRMI